MKISVLSRSSPLALLQVQEALPALHSIFPDAEFLCADTKSLGDRDLATPLTDPSIPTDYFTRELDSAQLAGDADLVVPVAENTAVLEQRYKALGGSIEVIHKPGVGHVHGLDDPTPIVDFILRNVRGE